MLPRTIQDAVRITRRLGFEYIWIDALCIIQGESEDWAHESSRMSQIYGNASLTLAADLAPSSDYGILRPRTTFHSHNFGPSQEYCLHNSGLGWADVPYEPLGQRGWSLQERILSTRILHFLYFQIAWECKTTVYMEEFEGSMTNNPGHFTTSDFRNFLNGTSFIHAEEFAGLPESAQAKDQECQDMSRASAWLKIVQELSIRKFTVPSDRLPCLAGLASAIEVPSLGNYLAGVWEKYTFISLSWYTRYPQKAYSSYRAPSWSWAATERQLMRFDDLSRSDPSPVEEEEWCSWFALFGPRLLTYQIIAKDSNNPKGEVQEGSYIVVNGYCRDIYVAEIPGTTFDEWRFLREEVESRRGMNVHMDMREQNRESKSYFAEDPANQDAEIGLATLNKYLCIQISREKKLNSPKTMALILEGGYRTEDGFKRVGLLAFDSPVANDPEVADWTNRSLKLF